MRAHRLTKVVAIAAAILIIIGHLICVLIDFFAFLFHVSCFGIWHSASYTIILKTGCRILLESTR